MFDLSEDSATASALSRPAARYRQAARLGGCLGSTEQNQAMQDDLIDNRAPGRVALQELAQRAAGGAGQQHCNHMNVLIDNLTGVTSTSAGQHRLDGRPVGAHDELDHRGIGWRVGSFAVRPGPGDPFA